MEVYVKSKKYIKPSSPTPQQLRTLNLSLLDQFAPPVYIPMFFYYPNTINIAADKRLQLLKQSLSKTLTHFYPLAGTIKDSLSIDCNDQGAYYVEARTDSHLIHFLNKPHLSFISKFLPSPSTWDAPTPGAPVAIIQVTVFACGGLVIGASVSHMILDGASMSVFVKAWADMANFGYFDQMITFDAPTVFPPSSAHPKEANIATILRPFFKLGTSATRRFLFDASAIARLKTNAATSSDEKNITRIELVSALIWKCATAAFEAKSGLIGKPSLVTHTVNMRRRAVPPFPQSWMGNLFWLAHAILKPDAHKDINSLVSQLREAKLKINEEFVRNLKGDGGFEHLVKVAKENAEAFSAVGSCGDGIGFTSLCRFGFYDIDFGWGKPAWISSVGSPGFECQFTNIVILLDTKSGDGIEAWVTLDEQVLAILEQDHQLLAFASVDPTPALD